MSRVVVVGAGLGGLAVAARLARQRHTVVVVEAAEVVGGQIARHSHGDFAWDTGPSFVTLPATLRDLFVKTGKPLETVVDLVPLEPLTHYRWADGTVIDLPNSGVNDVVSAFDAALGGRAADEWSRFHTHAAGVWARTREALVESPLRTRGDTVRQSLAHPRHVRAMASRRTLRGESRRFFSDGRQQMLLESYATGSGSDPRQAAAWLVVRPYLEQTFRGWTVRGGMRRLVEAVHDRAVDRGAVVHTGVPAVAVTTASGRVDGVRLGDGRVLPADVVVSDVDARQLYGRLLPDAGAQRRPARTPTSASVFTVMLALRGETERMRPRTVLLPAEPDAELDAVFGRRPAPAPDPTLSVHVSRDAMHAPAGSEAWTVQVAAPRHGVGPGALDWTAAGLADGYAQHLVDRLAARGLDVRDRVVVLTHRSPADLERATATPGGAAYGAGAVAPRLRSANRSPVPGLFLVGGSAHPGAGIPLVTMSAALVADMIGRE